MPSLIDLRRRIRSVRNTQQVTKAMKMVSAAKLRRAQERVLAARPYSKMFQEVLANVASAAMGGGTENVHPLLARRLEERVLVVAITADRGLAGAFNSNLIRTVQQFLAKRPQGMTEIEAIGRKGRDFFRKRNMNVVAGHIGFSQKVDYAGAAAIARQIAGRFERCEIDAVYLIYNEFKSLLAAKPVVNQLLPVEVPEQTGAVDYIYEQPPVKLLNSLLPRYVDIAVYQALLESSASEQAARMTAMEQATSNAGEMIANLTLYMNRVRQATITKELIEVVSGAGAQ